MNKRYLLIVFCLLCLGLQAQEKLNVKILNAADSTGLSDAVIVQDGKSYPAGQVSGLHVGKAEIRRTGFLAQQIELTAATFSAGELKVYLKQNAGPQEDIVITAARRETIIRQAPATIFAKSQEEIRNNASGNLYYALATFPQVDIVQLGGNVNVINTRGFNDAFQTRFVQLTNGVDVMLPALNITAGNVTGPIPIDIKKTELIAGPSSAMFGANAFQGLYNSITSTPFDGRKASFQVKGGSRDYIDVQGVLNVTVLKKKNLGFKVGGMYSSMQDWHAEDPTFNTYGKIASTLDIKNGIKGYLSSAVLPANDSATYLAALNYFNSHAGALIGSKAITTPGIKETDFADYHTVAAKATAGVFYRPIDKLEISYQYSFSYGKQILQGTTRYYVSAYSHLHDVNIKYDGFRFKLNYNSDKFIDAYNMLLTGNYMTRSNLPVYTNTLIKEYYENVFLASNGFSKNIDSLGFQSLFAGSQANAASAWWSPSSDTFKTRLNQITANANSLKGSGIRDQSSILHTEASYSLPVKFINIDVLGYFRYSRPVSFGTIFQDTLLDASKAPADGSIDEKLKYKKLSTYEGGGLVQLNKSVLHNMLDFWASVRLDKHSNFNLQVSPRGGVSVNIGTHSLRLLYQYGFRNPTLQNQYVKLDLGQILLLGNINGYEGLIDLNQYTAFGKAAASGNYDTTILSKVSIKKLKPETVHSIEFGYRGSVKGFFFEATAYYNWYANFIGNYRGFLVKNATNQSIAQDIDSIKTGKARLIQVAVNLTNKVQTYGASVMAGYKYKDKLTVMANYTYSGIVLPDSLALTVLPGFNTPKHKVNFSVEGSHLYKGLGASALVRWTDKTNWQSAIGNGTLNAMTNLDLAVFYQFDKPNTRITFGCTNVTGAALKYAIGAPVIGRMIYASLNMDIPF